MPYGWARAVVQVSAAVYWTPEDRFKVDRSGAMTPPMQSLSGGFSRKRRSVASIPKPTNPQASVIQTRSPHPGAPARGQRPCPIAGLPIPEPLTVFSSRTEVETRKMSQGLEEYGIDARAKLYEEHSASMVRLPPLCLIR